VTVQVVEVPEHAPPQPEKAYPSAGVSVRIIELPCVYDALQVEPQFMPEGALAMAPPLVALTVSAGVEVAGVTEVKPPPHAVVKKTTIIGMYANTPLTINRRELPIRKKK
jgi:hypothetical protein